MIVKIPIFGKNPFILPKICFLFSHNCPLSYNPLSFTSLLSPLVSALKSPLSLLKLIIIIKKIYHYNGCILITLCTIGIS